MIEQIEIGKKQTVKYKIKKQTCFAGIAIIFAILLPQIFHITGAYFGFGTKLGQMFLPMHLPVIAVGFIAGPFAGMLTGALAPLIAFTISGMPPVHILPFMTIELFFYGFSAGLLKKNRMNIIIKVLFVQIIGRVAKFLSIIFAIYVFNYANMSFNTVLVDIKNGIAGIIMQLILIPLIFKIIGKCGRHEY